MRERTLISHLESRFVGLSTREYRVVSRNRVAWGRSCRLAPSTKYHNRQIKPEYVHDGFSMLYNFLTLLLDIYRLNLHRKPAQAVHWPNQRALICRHLDYYAFSRPSGVCVCVCGGGHLHNDLYVSNSLDPYNNAFIPSPKFYKCLCECHWIVLDIEQPYLSLSANLSL
jgi:hypothetical protein